MLEHSYKFSITIKFCFVFYYFPIHTRSLICLVLFISISRQNFFYRGMIISFMIKICCHYFSILVELLHSFCSCFRVRRYANLCKHVGLFTIPIFWCFFLLLRITVGWLFFQWNLKSQLRAVPSISTYPQRHTRLTLAATMITITGKFGRNIWFLRFQIRILKKVNKLALRFPYLKADWRSFPSFSLCFLSTAPPPSPPPSSAQKSKALLASSNTSCTPVRSPSAVKL